MQLLNTKVEVFVFVFRQVPLTTEPYFSSQKNAWINISFACPMIHGP